MKTKLLIYWTLIRMWIYKIPFHLTMVLCYSFIAMMYPIARSRTGISWKDYVEIILGSETYHEWKKKNYGKP